MTSAWKEAATVILTVVKQSPVKASWKYNLLALERSSKSSFWPGSYVFPGGTTEPIDSDIKWLDLFSSFKMNIENLKIKKEPPIIENKTGEIPKLLSLKLTAIRETFEETGILLCFDRDKKSGFQKWASFGTYQNLDSWRSKVHNDASEFFNLCQNYSCCPDVNNIHFWSNWLTPTSKGKKRFDAAFFITCFKDHPEAIADKTEIEKLKWFTPEELIKACKSKDVWLPPPQIYETSRLLNFKDIEDLNDFALKRSTEGCDRWMPIQMKTLDGLISLLPGDGAYKPTDFHTPTKAAEINMSKEEFRSQYDVLHRMEIKEQVETNIIVKNYKPTYGHPLPVSVC